MKRTADSLENICLEYIAVNIRSYTDFEAVFDETTEELECHCVFRDPNIFLIQPISERLMNKLLEKKMLTNSRLSLFSKKNTILKSVKLNNIKVDKLGMKFLANHKVTSLECINIKSIGIADIIGCLNGWSITNMTKANFVKCSFIVSHVSHNMMKILCLRNLRSLNLAYTQLNQFCFHMICKDFKFLQRLNVSGTCIQSLEPLLNLQDQIKTLEIADLPHVKKVVPFVSKMYKLKHLDVSLVNSEFNEKDVGSSFIPDLLQHEDFLPNLVSLDISGWCDQDLKDLLCNFIDSHPYLEYLGIVLTNLRLEPSFSDMQYFQYPKHLVIGGLGNEEQIAVTLVRYKDRANYIQKALYHLFKITNWVSPEPYLEMLELILPVMETHSSVFGVQVAATACLFNITRVELSRKVHPDLLRKAVNQTLNAMSNFPKEFQLQKNSLLTLYNDRILLDLDFDRPRCIILVLEALCKFTEENVSQLAAATCSILASKISSKETCQLGSKVKYMSKLLEMVATRVDSRSTDSTLKHTLSALWNLTDDSPEWCQVFVVRKGVELFLKVLQTFKNDSTVEPKVLGLLNNISEVVELRRYLMVNELIEELHSLLKSENIDVSYFAAGIVSNLASSEDEDWAAFKYGVTGEIKKSKKGLSHSREHMLVQMEEAIMEWRVPQNEMVAYRSFKPFIPLLDQLMDYRVQLWALWAINHVSSKIPKRYCPMLKNDGGVELIRLLSENPKSRSEIRILAEEVIETLKKTGIK